MAMAMMRSGLQAAVCRGARTAPPKRSFSSSANHDDAYEAEKWEKITYVGIATCTVLAIYNLSKGHPHHEEPPPYPYLRIRNKEFPWDKTEPLGPVTVEAPTVEYPRLLGSNGLFEKKHKDH